MLFAGKLSTREGEPITTNVSKAGTARDGLLLVNLLLQRMIGSEVWNSSDNAIIAIARGQR